MSAATKAKQSNKTTHHGHGKNANEAGKFELYFQNELNVNRIKSHQWLAISRGENLKVSLKSKSSHRI